MSKLPSLTPQEIIKVLFTTTQKQEEGELLFPYVKKDLPKGTAFEILK